ncbi:ParA family protein [Citrobacter amalonaticus]|uniref:ParA family protein n=1 Tax=Citrobacter amalonaticus TaxID=35703 RepID=UPI0017878551|nr:ParA family protein [Citrobacter amalonaticus]MBE0395182.1 ParA family protein [Citrobacter amalonaticus]
MKLINIVSGKGGTGKTLLTAVLAEMLGNEDSSVLVIDLDVFVRGLTSLLYYHKKEKVQLCKDDELSISEFFMTKGDPDTSGKSKLSISRYRSFDVIPSVPRVDEILTFSDLMPDDKAEASMLISRLIKMIPEKYDFVFLDSRAGYDELIYASHLHSDITICVEEEDNISKITSENLINQMKQDCDNPIFRLINKSRSLTRDAGIESVSHLGKIPFDMDVMNSFGKESFWDDISKTLYKYSLSNAWNTLCNKMELSPQISTSRISPLGNESFEKKLQFYNSRDRVLMIYGALIGFMGLLYPFISNGMLSRLLLSKDAIFSITPLIMSALGFILLIYVVLKNKK